MLEKKYFLAVVLFLISLFHSLLWATPNDKSIDSNGKVFQKLQGELNKEKHKRKVLGRFEKEGLTGLSPEDISLTLLDYSYHYLNDSGKRQPFMIVQCRINISKFGQEADNLREYLKAAGKPAPRFIHLPDSERTILGLFDNIKDEFITFASLPKSVKPIVKFAELRKSKPEYIILSLVPNDNCAECESINELSTSVFGFDEKNKTYDKVLDIKTYRIVDAEDDLEGGAGYVDEASISWSNWINNEYRELIVTTERDVIVESHWINKETGEVVAPTKNDMTKSKANAKPRFKNKTEIYSWVSDKELSLVERSIDGKINLSRKRRQFSSGTDVTLKNGELYQMSGTIVGEKITSTNGKIDSYLVSPNKYYVAYSIIVGYTDDPGIYEDNEKVPQVPLCHIVVMDLESKKKLREIKPPSENEPFILMDRWISNEVFSLYDADGFAVGRKYVYNAGTDELRQANMQEMESGL